RLSVLSKRFEKARRLFSGELDHAHFCDHYRPAENRTNRESQEDDLSRDGGMLEGEKESAAREEFREQNREQVELINNVFRKKRKVIPRSPQRLEGNLWKLPWCFYNGIKCTRCACH